MILPRLAGWAVREVPREVAGLLADAALRGVVVGVAGGASSTDPALLVIACDSADHAPAWGAYAAVLGPRDDAPLVLVMPRPALSRAVDCGDPDCPVTRELAAWEPAALDRVPCVISARGAHHIVRLEAPVSARGGAA